MRSPSGPSAGSTLAGQELMTSGGPRGPPAGGRLGGQELMTGGGPGGPVVVASRHGATAEIGAALARELAAGAAGVSAVAVPASHRPDPTPFDAVVLGSAVYAGRWL